MYATTPTGLRIFVLAMIVCGTAEGAKRPNVLFMMVDDLGYSDLGCYGGEIETPHLDKLAAEGLRFSQFYNTAKCHSSRVALLTGQYCIAAGDVNLSHAVTSAETLRAGGYFTAMTGKWHLKKEPTDFGFERYFGHLSGACNYFKGDKTFRMNGEPWTVPEDSFYTTVANADYALKFLSEARQTNKPWYMYIAFNAPHAPLQALPQDYAKYKGKYDQGWDAVRTARVAKQKETGLLPQSLSPSPQPEHVPKWASLSEKRRAFEAKRMTTLAAMIDRVDQEVGRLVENLRAAGELDNTLIWFVSDNGACPYDRRSTNIDGMPTDGSLSWSDSTGWAWARNSPFRYYKQNQFEGGISTPAIVHWPAGLKTPPGHIARSPAHLIDVLPTLADVCESPVPNRWPDRDLRPVSGVSLAPVFRGKALESREPIHLLFSNDRALRDGDWKAVSFRGETWELYNVRSDRTELNDLAEAEPDRLNAMVSQWTQMAKDVLHASPKSYAPVKPASLPHKHPEWTDFSKELKEGDQRRKRNGKTTARAHTNAIRARKNTKMTVVNGELQLTFSGDDPGIAMDSISKEIPNGPYQLTFSLASTASGDGEVFFTTTPDVTLPKGFRVPFEIPHDGNRHDMKVELPTDGKIHKLRLDVSGSGNGTATIANLGLPDHTGKILIRWPGQ